MEFTLENIHNAYKAFFSEQEYRWSDYADDLENSVINDSFQGQAGLIESRIAELPSVEDRDDEEYEKLSILEDLADEVKSDLESFLDNGGAYDLVSLPIYHANIIEFFSENMAECEDEYSMMGGSAGSIMDQITSSVHLVIEQQAYGVVNELRDAVESDLLDTLRDAFDL